MLNFSSILVPILASLSLIKFSYNHPDDRFAVKENLIEYSKKEIQDFSYWVDTTHTYTYDGVTDLSAKLQSGTALELTSNTENSYLYYIFVPQEEWGLKRGHIMEPMPEQFINFIAKNKYLIFLDLHGGRSSDVYPPNYFGNYHKDAQYAEATPITGTVLRPITLPDQSTVYETGKWQLIYWVQQSRSFKDSRNHGKPTSILLSISFEDSDHAAQFFKKSQSLLITKK